MRLRTGIFRNLKPILKTYFAVPSANPNEQFYYFTSARLLKPRHLPVQRRPSPIRCAHLSLQLHAYTGNQAACMGAFLSR